MERKRVKLPFFLFLTLISFLVFQWFYLDIAYFRLVSYIGSNGLVVLENTFVALSIFILGTLFLSSTLFQLIYKTFNYNLLRVEYIFYFILLFFFLFFKSIGIQGITLNPLSFINDFLFGQAVEIIFNILFFIPLGLLISYHYNSFFKSLIVSIIGITVVEILQYTFSLGFFDVGDILTNTVGIMIGWYFYVLLHKQEYKVR